MAELVTGKLLFNQDKRKWQVEFFNERKQQPSKMFCDVGEISADIPKNEAEQFDVQFERKPPHGEPIQIRLAGTNFAAPAGRGSTPPEPMAQRQGNVPSQREDRDTQRERREPRQERTNDDMPREFHNPYNFVPALPRPNETLGELGDCEPSGHDRFHAELLSGKLCVKMTGETPLLLSDTAKVEVQETDSNYAKKGHKTFPVRVRLEKDKDGKTIEVPDINPTAIKGMLRSAYEAVTNSRLSVFQKHDERLAFRMESTEGGMSVPARIVNGKIVLYTGTSMISGTGRPVNEEDDKNATLCAAWLPIKAKEIFDPEDPSAVMPKHNEKKFAWLEKIQHINRNRNESDFQYWRVRRLVSNKSDLGSQPQPSANTPFHVSLKEFIDVEGYVCNTGDNIKNKHDERFFFIYGREESQIRKIDFHHAKHGGVWDRLIKNYRQEHSEKDGKLKDLSKDDGLVWSRHIQRTEFEETSKEAKLRAENLENSPLCYARVKENEGKLEVEELYPVIISRRLHSVSPDDLLGECLKPASDIKKLSPADRVFGWVGQNMKGKNAYRGQIRIGEVKCEREDAINNFAPSIPLQILGQPKPQQGRFYVAQDKDGKAQDKGLTNEQAGYLDKDKKGLRGRKVYPHHKSHEDIKKSYWDSASEDRTWKSFEDDGKSPDTKILLKRYFQEFRRPPGKDQRDKQNRSVKGWIKPSTVFKFDIHFINLSEVELGALIWLLSLEDGYHRFGGGKPLGFGSVKLEICRDEGKEIIVSDIRSGIELAESRYSSLADDKLKYVGIENLAKEFQKAVLRAYKPDVEVIDEQIQEMFESISFIEAFMQLAKGFEDNLPIHYPRTREEGTTEHPAPNPEGESFKWFVDNSRTRKNFQTEKTEVVHGVALPNLAEDVGLPILNHKRQGRR
jgi:CRISPR-associated protein (TIGR03986 family)